MNTTKNFWFSRFGWVWAVLAVVGGIAVAGGCTGIGLENGVPAPVQQTHHLLAVGESLQASGHLAATEVRSLVYIRQEQSWDILRTPAIAGPTDRVLWIVLAPQHSDATTLQAMMRWTGNGWSTQQDTQASSFVWEGRPGFLFDLGQHPVDTEIQAAFRITTGNQTAWLNFGNQNYRVHIQKAQELQWIGYLQVHQSGLLRKIPGDSVFRGHGVQVTVETYPATSQVDVQLHWTVGGFEATKKTPMSVSQIQVGTHRNNVQWSALIPTEHLTGSQELIFWVEARGVHNTLWDSRQGANYKARISTPPAPTWAQAGVYTWSKARQMPDGSWSYMNWFYNEQMANPLKATPDQYQAYASAPIPALEVYIPGVTDRPENRDALGQFVRVEVWSPFFSGQPDGAWKAYPMSFHEWHGNNARFRWNVREFRAPQMPAVGVDCAANGLYPFKYRISTDQGARWYWVGTQGLPNGGENRFLDWKNMSYAPMLTVDGQRSGDALTWEARAGQPTSRNLTLINTNSYTVEINRLWLQDNSTSWTLTVAGCSSLENCRKALLPGERFSLAISFTAPTNTAEPQYNQLLLDVVDPAQRCQHSGTFPLSLQGNTIP